MAALRQTVKSLVDVEKKATENFADRAKAIKKLKPSAPQAAALRNYEGMLKNANAILGAASSMRNVIESLPENVLVNDQLTAVRSQVEASTNFMAPDIDRTANFTTDDRTMLAVHISAKYPDLADILTKPKDDPQGLKREEFLTSIGGNFRALLGVTGTNFDLEALVDRLVESRRTEITGGPERPVPPYGVAFQKFWEGTLAALDTQAARVSSMQGR
jgi:hypothetical protein